MRFASRENKFPARSQCTSQIIVNLKLEVQRILLAKYDSTTSRCIIASRIKTVYSMLLGSFIMVGAQRSMEACRYCYI